MRSAKTILVRHATIGAIGLALAIGFMTLPFLAAYREQLATMVGLSTAIIWAPLGVCLLGLHWLLLKRSISDIAEPLDQLVKEAEREGQNFAFKIKSKCQEEDALKRCIEAANLKAKEADDRAEEYETELAWTAEQLEASKQKAAHAELKLAENEQRSKDLYVENDRLNSSKLALELTLENERKSKVGVEVEKRSEEIYNQMERAVTAAAYKAIWIPSLVHELKTPISHIEERSSRLKENWSQTSFASINDELAYICQQAQAQLKLLDDILARQPSPVQEAPAKPETPSQPKSDAPTKAKLAIAAKPEEPTPAAPAAPSFEIPADSDAAPTEAAPKPAQRILHTAESSSLDLKTLLHDLANDFAKVSPDLNICLDIDPDIEVQIEDDTLFCLLQNMVGSAVEQLAEGDLTIGVDLHADHIDFDVACDGPQKANRALDLTKAEILAEDLAGEIEVDAPSPSECHLSFRYQFN